MKKGRKGGRRERMGKGRKGQGKRQSERRG